MKRILALLVVIALGAGGAYYWWISSPQYAVQQAVAAIKDHNVSEFHSWVDVHHLSGAAIEDLTSEPMQRVGSAEMISRMIGLSLFGLLKPVAVDALDGQIDKLVATLPRLNSHTASSPSALPNPFSTNANPPAYSGGSPTPYGANPQQSQANGVGSGNPSGQSGLDYLDDDEEDQPHTVMGAITSIVKPPSLKKTLKDFGLTPKNFRGFGESRSQGDVAEVPLKFFSPKLNCEFDIVLQLNRLGGRWQVTRIASLQDNLRLLAESQGLRPDPSRFVGGVDAI